ncbi:(ZYRO0G21934g) [Zygosaccharomyces parabailii]|uniref:ZYBA0S03-04676g1_1 n=1 Tax=Zygosaccharomyces bailii (strain CLIB 213 / ATCC 58445 / CBS 680 / BCRC 21525 / NBRC 1098 / NCYC 1416 / NRRL Y-2227) TaxID=1333698 RepID=A0A8J2T5V4_ZYGB2|nr:(ZYRO0G21934g) [Zygosaccharomyces parabailii]CDF88906.1 ZYBA0S03-04676g1_1 [Zygosaccharomyces bailii CLIB 213]CDH15992.1 uncharacterized protein ZBAI_07780 [Zygosaccharomyces bailii ISA1307]SJM82987.1 uncharacterized protein ZBIST_0771 [Zygosaccharomyces bailii]
MLIQSILLNLVALIHLGICAPIPTSLIPSSTQGLGIISHRLADTIEKTIATSHSKYNVRESILKEAAQRLSAIDSMVTEIEETLQNETQILFALNLLFQLKVVQMTSDSQTINKVFNHLDQVSEALRLVVEKTTLREENIVEKLSVGGPYEDVTAVRNGDSHPGVKRILSSGGLVFLMLSTASDVCVITGPEFCLAVYLAGTGGVVIWLASIYRTALGFN